MGIKVCAIQGAGLFWGPERGTMGTFWVSEKYSSHKPMVRMHLYLV